MSFEWVEAKLVAKSACWDVQVRDAVQYCKQIEIQLLGNEKIDDEEDYAEICKTYIDNGAEVVSVHTDLFGESDIRLFDLMFNPEKRTRARNACRLAEYIASQQGTSQIAVIVHGDLSAREFEIPEFMEKITAVASAICDDLPHVKLVIENVPPILIQAETEENEDGSTRYLFSSQCNGLQAKYLKLDESGEKFGTVYDLCHYMMTKEMFDAISPIAYIDHDLVSELKELEGTLDIIHVNSFQGHGWETDHGIAFHPDKKDDIEMLKAVLKAIDSFQHKPMLVIEVREKDYADHKNLKETLEAIDVAVEQLRTEE